MSKFVESAEQLSAGKKSESPKKVVDFILESPREPKKAQRSGQSDVLEKL